jgi:hypothetical protein
MCCKLEACILGLASEPGLLTSLCFEPLCQTYAIPNVCYYLILFFLDLTASVITHFFILKSEAQYQIQTRLKIEMKNEILHMYLKEKCIFCRAPNFIEIAALFALQFINHRCHNLY